MADYLPQVLSLRNFALMPPDNIPLEGLTAQSVNDDALTRKVVAWPLGAEVHAYDISYFPAAHRVGKPRRLSGTVVAQPGLKATRSGWIGLN